MALLRIILILILVYLILNFIARLFFSNLSKKAGRDAHYRNHDHSQKRKEGEVTVEGKGGKSNKRFQQDEGEYIKYEEVKDEEKK